MSDKSVNEKYCQECGKVINIRAEICPHCGVRQPGTITSNVVTVGRNKTTAGLFALFLGGLGVHKFYLGQIWQGLLYLIFCWTFIPAIIGFIEGLMLLSMNDTTFSSKYS